jgi:trigger factor
MKIDILSKKGLKTTLSIIIDKKTIQNELDKRLTKLKSEVSLKGFRPGKVPTEVIKSQFGKSIYGEVIDKLLHESSHKALEEKKIKAAGQPKIDLKTFGEGKDLNYTLEVDSLPEIKLANFESFSATEFLVKIENKIIDEKISDIAKNNKSFSDKKDIEKAETGNQVVFDYSASVDGNKFEGSEGKDVKLELGKDLFLKGFDEQLIGVKKNETKTIKAILPASHPKKELANKKAIFECKVLNVQKPEDTKIDDNFAKNMGAKDLNDLKKLIEQQVASQYKQALDSITKKEILDQIEKLHKVELPKNLVDQEVHKMTHNLKKEEIEKHKTKNTKLAESRIKLGLILNEYGEKNTLKVSDDDVKAEIQKQIKGMPGQEKMVLDYYQKNPSASQNLKGAIYEDKILTLFKSKIKLTKKDIRVDEAEKIITNFNKSTQVLESNNDTKIEEKKTKEKDTKPPVKRKSKLKKVSKK